MALGIQNYNGGTSDEYGTFLSIDRQMGSGVVEGLLVAANATPNMTVYVQPGSGLIPTGTYPSSYNYRFHIDTASPGAAVTVGTAAASPRIDYIVAYVDKTVAGSTAGANVNNTNGVLKLADVQGTPAGSPSVPTVSQIQTTIGASNPYIILAQIAVGANVTTITNTNITDLRTFAADRNDAALGQQSYVDSGLVWTATTGLAASMTAGKAYINVGGTMVPASASAISSYSFTASQDTYVSINVNGIIAYSLVASGAAAPSLPANSVWLAKVMTSGSAVTSVVQDGLNSLGVPLYPRPRTPVGAYVPVKFSAYSGAGSALTAAGWTRVAFNTKEYDTGSNFDAVTNYRFTVSIAGYYQVSAGIRVTAGGAGEQYVVSIYKNGTEYKRGIQEYTGAAGDQMLLVSPPPMLLAAGDYLEVWAYNGTGGGKNVGAGSNMTYFGGYLVSTS